MVRRLLNARCIIKLASDTMFYAVRDGRRCGIYKTWDECKEQVNGYSGARFKKFKTKHEALTFMRGESYQGNAPKRRTAPYASRGQSYSRTAYNTHTQPSYNLSYKSSFSPSLSSVSCSSVPISRSVPVVYTDGGCYANGRRKAQAGIGVFWGEGDRRNVSARLEGNQTNQRAELNAAIRALERAHQDNVKELEIRTDSMYTINCATDWICTWKRNGWKSAAGEPVKNQPDIKKLDNLCQQIKVNWVHVKAHQGIFGNEQADKLSKIGAMKDAVCTTAERD